MWIKICGNTNLEDAQHALEAGAHALGFVFAPSPRQVTAAQVKAMVGQLPASVETYGVFVDGSLDAGDEIARIVVECGLTGVQLHRSAIAPAGDGMLARVRRSLQAHQAQGVKIISALAFEDGLEKQLKQASQDADAVLVDSRPSGGTGIRFDWQAASGAFRKVSGHARVIAAGGLNPENVEEAIATLAPWGVDVVTGVESMPGRKDWRKVEAFVKAAKLQGTKMRAEKMHTANMHAGVAGK